VVVRTGSLLIRANGSNRAATPDEVKRMVDGERRKGYVMDVLEDS
jgi:hypothetical protein